MLGLSVSSSWGNDHAPTYRALIKGLCARGHSVLFLERNLPRHAQNRDMPELPYGAVAYYESVDELKSRYVTEIARADAVIVGSFVPDGVAVGEWVTSCALGLTAFYDIDTPVTIAKLKAGDEEYLSRPLIPRFDLYLSSTGGPTLIRLEREFGARMARALFCSVDPTQYYTQAGTPQWDLGYLGTGSDDWQAPLESLMLGPARQWSDGKMVVAGSMYPSEIDWPANVERCPRLSPSEHCDFYKRQRFTLNLPRASVRPAGHSLSMRLLEAAACGTPIISDWWDGLNTFFEPGTEILVARSGSEVLHFLRKLPDAQRQLIGQRARARVLGRHTAYHRACELEGHLAEAGHEWEKPAARAMAASASAAS